MKTTWLQMSFLLSCAFDCSSSAMAFNQGISFTPTEIALHQQKMKELVVAAPACLKRKRDEYLAFYEKWGISQYYGSNTSFAQLTPEEKAEKLVDLEKPAELLTEMKRTSCIDLVMACLSESLLATGQKAIWEKIYSFIDHNDYDVMALLQALHDLGWKIYYWNPDTSRNKYYDNIDFLKNPFNYLSAWGYHEYRYLIMNRTGKYYQNDVDDLSSLTNFGETSPEFLKTVPYWIGSANTGFHSFSGVFQNEYESHSLVDLSDNNGIEVMPFNPVGDGGPNGFYRSGLIAIPPTP